MYYIKKTTNFNDNSDVISKVLGIYDDLQGALECLEYIYRSLRFDMYELCDKYKSDKTLSCNMFSSDKEFVKNYTFTCREVQSKSMQIYMDISYERREHVPMVSTVFQDKFKGPDEECVITYKVIPMA